MKSQILFIGDSITHGTDWASRIDFADVQNIAVPGYSTDDVQAQLNEIKHINSQVVCILLGTNDFGNPELDRTGEEVGQRVVEIVKSILNNSQVAHIIVSSILPRDIRFTDRIRTANGVISSLAHDRMTYLDCWPALSGNDSLLPEFLLEDGFDVHLSDAGYEAWSKLLVPALKRVAL